MPTLATDGPGEPWRVAEECKAPDHVRYLWNYGWDGPDSDLALCFVAASNGDIPYAKAAEPPGEARRRVQAQAHLEAQDRARMARGGPPTVRTMPREPKWYRTGSDFSAAVQTYVGERVASLQLSPELRQQLKNGRSAAHWLARWQALEQALPWVLSIIAFIWVFTAVMGWIVRGFAGVPTGHDFKPTAGV